MEANKETKKLAYKTLAANKYAERPPEIPKHQWHAIRSVMFERYMREWMRTPDGLYSDSQIWKQTFMTYLK